MIEQNTAKPIGAGATPTKNHEFLGLVVFICTGSPQASSLPPLPHPPAKHLSVGRSAVEHVVVNRIQEGDASHLDGSSHTGGLELSVRAVGAVRRMLSGRFCSPINVVVAVDWG